MCDSPGSRRPPNFRRMTRVRSWLALAAAALLAPSSWAEDAPGNLTVVELFTSQGCNSCPPADRLLGELAARKDVLGLSYHVDYWDYLGWKDTFSLPESSVRQRGYVGHAGGRYAYTPQIVVGGEHQVVGSRRAAVETAIREEAAEPMTVEIRARPDGGGMWHVAMEPTELPEIVWVWLVTFDDRHDVDIERGENSGKTLSYYNVVRRIERIATWDGRTALDVPVDMRQAWADGRDGCAVIVQTAGFGPVLGAARIRRNGS